MHYFILLCCEAHIITPGTTTIRWLFFFCPYCYFYYLNLNSVKVVILVLRTQFSESEYMGFFFQNVVKYLFLKYNTHSLINSNGGYILHLFPSSSSLPSPFCLLLPLPLYLSTSPFCLSSSPLFLILSSFLLLSP